MKASIEHDFNQKLEEIRTDFRKSEESFKADLRAKESQIAALQTGALSGMVSRQVALDKRRLEAIDQLWAGIEALKPLTLAASWMKTIDFEKALKTASEDPRTRDLFTKMSPQLDPKNLPNPDVHKVRPYVSEMAWALFSAYQAIVGYAAAQIFMLRVGLNSAHILDSTAVSRLVLAALPHYQEYIEKHGYKVFPLIVDTLEAELLKELQRMMRGEESDKHSVEQAAKIMQEVRDVNKAIDKGST
ncbi:hypothetical protein [Nitrospira sp. BLG_1]|uniref:hypothetical protein n=1 Tax=Nitrospira sp. BLG_1 TaxID=3395883 RepID=UPI0039BCD971